MQTLGNREENTAEGNLVMDCELLCLNEESIVVFCQTLIGLMLMRQVKAQSLLFPEEAALAFVFVLIIAIKYDHSKC